MLRHMRTTILLPDDLYAEVRRVARDQERTVTSLIEEALRESLARRAVVARVPPFVVPVLPGARLRPGVDLDDSSALLDLMEGL